jgi:hypothetical protein
MPNSQRAISGFGAIFVVCVLCGIGGGVIGFWIGRRSSVERHTAIATAAVSSQLPQQTAVADSAAIGRAPADHTEAEPEFRLIQIRPPVSTEPKAADLPERTGEMPSAQGLIDKLSGIIESRPQLVVRDAASQTWRWTAFGQHHLDDATLVIRELSGSAYGVELTTRINRIIGDEVHFIWANLHRETLFYVTRDAQDVRGWWETEFEKAAHPGGRGEFEGVEFYAKLKCTGLRTSAPHQLWLSITPIAR